ncbi:MAG: zinc-binding alcohol dehydrogenase, partial [Bacteroidota bacterium]
YSLVGEIAQGDHPRQGQLVHLLYPHQDLLYVQESDLFWIPEGIPAPRASLASNLETALNAVWDAQVMPGDRILVVGFGLIGSLVARLLSLMPATELKVLELDADRQATAMNMGFEVSANLTPAERESFDGAFHSSVSSSGLQSALDAVGKEGKVVELSWYGEKIVNLGLGGRFHSQRKQIISSQVSRLPLTHQARWDFLRRKEAVFRLLTNPLFDQHLGEEVPFSQAPKLYDQLRRNQARALSYWLNYT